MVILLCLLFSLCATHYLGSVATNYLGSQSVCRHLGISVAYLLSAQQCQYAI